jgi:putative endonuclease
LCGYDNDETTLPIAREKAMKEWKRQWKLTLIEATNPDWRDLYEDLL